MHIYYKLILVLLSSSILFGACVDLPEELRGKNYKFEEVKNGICLENTRCISLDGGLIAFIDEGYVVIIYKDSNNVSEWYYTGIDDAVKILSYQDTNDKNAYVLLRENGDAYLLDEEGNHVIICHRVFDIEVEGNDIVALTTFFPKKGFVRYRGDPKEELTYYEYDKEGHRQYIDDKHWFLDGEIGSGKVYLSEGLQRPGKKRVIAFGRTKDGKLEIECQDGTLVLYKDY